MRVLRDLMNGFLAGQEKKEEKKRGRKKQNEVVLTDVSGVIKPDRWQQFKRGT